MKSPAPSSRSQNHNSNFNADLQDSTESHPHSHLINPNKNKRHNNNRNKKEALTLAYDIIMLIVIVIDLTIISLDLMLTSQFAGQVAHWLSLSEPLNYYLEHIHHPLRVLGGFFTIFLIAELCIRWIISILNKEYMRWFFFPFAHWYEVLGCFPQLRALRLLRAFFIGRKLYQLGYQVLPQKWIAKGKFYYDIIFEELSDRVILTATDNIRQQFEGPNTDKILATTLEQHRPQIKAVLTSMLKEQLAPELKRLAQGEAAKELSVQVGASVQDALSQTPELRRYLRMIPIAGRLIESELHTISQHIGENLVQSLTTRLTQTQVTDALIEGIAESIAHVDLDHPELEALVADIANEGLTVFEAQIKVQQWKHQEQLHL